jgi:hypothetical protein
MKIQDGVKPTHDELIEALARFFDAPESAAISWLQDIVRTFDARAANERLAKRTGLGL